MTTADKKLCHDLAEAEEWTTQGHVHTVLGQHWSNPNGDFNYTSSNVPDWYLTDPAEKWRMLEALVETYSGVTLHRYKDEKTFCSIDNGLWHTTGETTTHAVAEAHLVRLKETK